MKKLIIAVLFVLLIPIAASAFNLTGTWSGDNGTTYYVRQIGSEVFWYGENDPSEPSWSNVAHGKISGIRVILSWADVPKGSVLQSGILVLKVTNNGDTMEATTKTGGYLDAKWTRN